MPHRPDIFSQPQLLGGQLTQTSALSAVSWGENRIDVFGTDGNGMLQHWWFDSGWNPMPENLPGVQGRPLAVGQFASPSVSAISRGDQLLDIYGVGSDGTLWYWGYDGNNQGWLNNKQAISLGGPLVVGQYVSAVSAVSWGSTRLDIFGISPDGALQHWQFDSNLEPFLPERQNLGGHLSGVGLSAVTWGEYRLDVFGTGSDNGLWHWWYDSGAGNFSTGPEPLGGPSQLAATPLSAVSWEPNRLDIFGLSTQSSLQHWWYDNGWGKDASPEDLGGGGQLIETLRADTYRPGSLEIFAGTNDPALQHWWCEDDTWLPRYKDPEKWYFYGPPVSTVSRGYNRLDVFSCAIDGELVWWFRE